MLLKVQILNRLTKHIVAAFIVTPVLAVLGYWVADKLVGEAPVVAQVGQNYPLMAASNCRYASGYCDLRNANFGVRLEVVQEAGAATLRVTSKHQLSRVLVSVTQAGAVAQAPQALEYNGLAQYWEIVLKAVPLASTELKFVANVKGITFYAQTSFAFSQ